MQEQGKNSSENQASPLVHTLKTTEIIQQALALLKTALPEGLYYHSLEHTEDVLSEALLFGSHDKLHLRDLELLAVAAAYHDTGFVEKPENHEQASAAIAKEAMKADGSFSAEEMVVVCSMILDTKLVHSGPSKTQKPSSRLSSYLLDADTSNYGRADFFEKFELVKRELDAEDETFLRHTLTLIQEHTWQTPAALVLRQKQKEKNIAQLEKLLAFPEEELSSKEPETASPVATLSILNSSGKRSIHKIHEGQLLRIGRSRDNDLVLEEDGVSRFHSVLSASRSGIVLSDLNSLNGTFINKRRVSTPTDLSSDDIITIGSSTLEVDILRFHSHEESGSEMLQTTASRMQRVFVTVLLADVKGYTKLSETLPPEKVTTMLNSWFKNVTKIINNHGGEVDKFIGDAAMAVWFGQEQESCAAEAMNAALEILQATDSLSTAGNWEYHSTSPWCCRVALNSGEALMGAVGPSNARNFTVLGDAINVAFRIESHGGKSGVDCIVGSSTAELLGEKFPLESIGSVPLQGREQEVLVFTLKT